MTRIATFDLLRGYFLLAIVLDHLFFYPNGLDWVAMQGNLYVSAAEGFFLISGIVLGIVRGVKLIDKPFKDAARLLLKRGLHLYVLSIILTLIFTALGWFVFNDHHGLKEGIWPFMENLPLLLWQTLTFQYDYGWADYLKLYSIFLFVSPFALWLLRRGWWYVLLTVSIILWLLFPNPATTPENIQHLLQPLSWQLLFFGGFTIGFYWPTIVGWWLSRTQRVRKILIGTTVTIGFGSLLANIFIVFGAKMVIPIPADIAMQLDDFGTLVHAQLFDKEQLPLPRVLMFMSWFMAAFWLVRKFETVIIKYAGWLLLAFGTNSLYVYTMQAIIIFFVHLFVDPGALPFNFVVSIGVIALIRLAIHYQILMKLIPR
ncbi:MAG: hypothetical protein JWN33_164 [Candidatus Saccharibacteria bacterium]|nr:hypothetical protein [Candidatus Saccharibacteria bacterium]